MYKFSIYLANEKNLLIKAIPQNIYHHSYLIPAVIVAYSIVEHQLNVYLD